MNVSSVIRAIYLISTVIFLILIISCSTAPVFPEDEVKLKERVYLLYKAEAQDNSELFYSLFAKEMKDELSHEELENNWKSKKYKLKSWKIINIEYFKRDSANMAKVPMDIAITNNKGIDESVKDQTDYWVFRNGAWYWFWRGWPSD